MAVNRSLLKQTLSGNNAYLKASDPQKDLLNAQAIQGFALDSNNFGGGRAGVTGLAAQLGAAGAGAYAQHKARKEIAEKELAGQQAFATQFPQYAELASQLSPETRQAYSLEVLKSSLPKGQENQIISGESGYYSVDKNNPQNQAVPVMGPGGQLIKPQKPSSTTVNVGEQQNFKNATTLRSEYSDKSKNFVGVKEGYEKVSESLKDPSPAGDIAAIFGFVKAQDPTSTVREGEFAIAENAKPLLEKYGLEKFNNIWKGERLTASQRNDFLVRTKKLYDRAESSQNKLADQYTKIAKRNGLDSQDVIVDFSTTVENPSNQQLSQKTQSQNGIAEGTIIQNKAGQKMIAKGGKWQPL